MSAGESGGPRRDRNPYEAIVENMTDMAFIVDSDLQLEFASESGLSRTAVSHDATEGSRIMELMKKLVADGETAAKFERALETVSADDADTAYPVVVELELDAPDGTITSEYRCSPHSSGDETKVVVVARDITERKQRERELQESKEQYERLFETIPVAVGVNSLGERGEFEFVNQTAVGMFDAASKEALEQHSPGELYAEPAEREQFADRLREQGTIEQYETEFTTLDGNHLEVSITAELTEIGGEQRIVGIVEDISERKQQERELRNEKEFTDGVLNSLSDVFYAFDTAGNLIEYNEQLPSVTGYDHGELEAMAPWDFFPEDERERIVDAVSQVIETENPVYSLEGQYLTKSGETIPYEFSGAPYYDSDGTVAGFVGFGRDITDRRKRERELEEKQERLQGLFDKAPDPIFVQDEKGKFTDVNEKAAEKLGYSRGELLEMEAADIDAAVDRSDAEELLSMVRSEGRMVKIQGRHQCADGSTYPVDVRVTPLETDGSDRFLSHARDITEREEREAELERKQNFLEQTQEVAAVGGWEVDLRADTLRWTDEVYHIHGLDLDFEPTVEGAIDLYHPEDKQTVQDAVERAMTEGEPYELEVRVVRPDGEIRWTRARGKSWEKNGEIVGVRGTFQDITDRKEREQELRESNERLEQFAYVASHDMQEPLRTISNYTEILAEDYVNELDEEAQRFIDIVVTGSERMQSMINGLLDYSRVTTRGGAFEPINTEQVVVDTVEDLQFMLAEHDGTVEIGELPTVEADGDQLHQLFQNLVKNAVEHAGEDPVTIDIRASEEPNQYRFEVEDDGVGIAANRQEKIFRIFKSGEQYQASSQARGLGLAICDNIVRRHGGDIWVESESGDGATFVFTIRKDKDNAKTASKKQ